ncbi:histidine phosphatase family protein [Kribbella italica]|uniref:Broad specificity phosphatase PhoE n=1 Tax=Kribbella italica TaxID=1540520 RepID=A0A7W9MU13_9ACTN|nr:histidine phosphatase family protein [Kribbella italica]MBB5835473.1 broad specificity phosphatase PhoE [Kribbella italica]
MLVLVRHAMPVHGPEVPARDWVLSAEGRTAARELCARLPAGARLVASTEVKAIETIGAAITDRRFDEIERVEAYAGDFRTRRRAYVGGADHEDWERREDVVRRFADGVAEHVAAAGGRPVVIASHGMAMTLWLTATIGLADPAAFWEDLRFPDALVVGSGSVVRLG